MPQEFGTLQCVKTVTVSSPCWNPSCHPCMIQSSFIIRCPGIPFASTPEICSSMPVCIVGWPNGALHPIELAQAMCQYFPHVRLEIIPSAAHIFLNHGAIIGDIFARLLTELYQVTMSRYGGLQQLSVTRGLPALPLRAIYEFTIAIKQGVVGFSIRGIGFAYSEADTHGLICSLIA